MALRAARPPPPDAPMTENGHACFEGEPSRSNHHEPARNSLASIWHQCLNFSFRQIGGWESSNSTVWNLSHFWGSVPRSPQIAQRTEFLVPTSRHGMHGMHDMHDMHDMPSKKEIDDDDEFRQ
jgi:hypothetical protein